MQQDIRRTTMAYYTQENSEEEAYNGQEEAYNGQEEAYNGREEEYQEDMPYEYGQEKDELWGYYARDNHGDHQPYVENAQEESFALYVGDNEVECRNCHVVFSSNNRLHRYIRNTKCKKKPFKVVQLFSKVTQPAEGIEQLVPSI